MKQQANKHRSEQQFQVGDWVFFRFQPYMQVLINQHSSMKLSPKFYGPHRVMECVRPVAYQLNLPASSKLHSIFHVSCLKKKLGELIISQRHLLDNFKNREVKFEPQAILDRQLVKKKNQAVVEILIQWANFPIKDATWEPYETMEKIFSEFVITQP